MRAIRKRAILAAGVVGIGLLLTGAAPAFSSTQAPLRRIDPAAVAALPKDPAAYAHAKAVANARYASWAQRHGLSATPSRDTAVSGSLNQPGLDASDQLFTPTPPDTTGAIGPSNYVEMVNSEVAVYSSSDLTATPTTLDQATFFGDASASSCDGQIQWDEEGQRWIYSGLNCAADFGSENLYVGFSKGTSPLPLDSTNWCQYEIPTGSNLMDYDKLGHDDTQIIIGANEYPDDGFSEFDGGKIFVVPKPAPGTISTCPSQSAEVGRNPVELSVPDAFTPVPANIADASASGYVVANDNVSSTKLDLYTISPGVTTGSMSPSTVVTVPSYSVPASVPQPGTTNGDTLDSLDGRLTQAAAITDPGTGKEGVWTQHTVDGGGPSVVRWYELTPGGTTPTQSGTVHGPSGRFAFNGAISPAGNGTNAAIFYNSGSSTVKADLRAQDRRSDTPAGTTIEDLQLATSPYSDIDFSCNYFFDGEPCRWGDYAGASPDPSSPCVVWGTGELTTVAADGPDSGSDPMWGTQNAAIDTSSGSCSVTALVAATGSGTGMVTSDDDQISCGSTCSASYSPGATVTLTATPDPDNHSRFVGWSGACSGTDTTCELTMNQVKSVTAIFGFEQEALGYTKAGNGSGSVSSNPAGLSCSSSCSPTFDIGTSVELTASPSTGSTFTGWAGDCTVVNGKCDVSMDQAHSVTATFTLQSESLTVSKSGAGSGTVTGSGISCGSTCSHSYNYGTSVALTATPSTGSVFGGWSGGGCSGTGNCTVAMTAAQSVTATFTVIQEALTVTKSGTGSGTVTGTGISCGSTCSHSFNYGTSVTLTATPDAHVTFDGWSGACSGSGSCVVSLTAASSVTATFTAILCEVPGVKGKTLARAKSAIQDANCSVGSVTKKFSKKVKKGRVMSQSPASGAEKAFGSDVKLVVSKGKKKK